MFRSRTSLTALAATLLVLALPSLAHAEGDPIYDVTLEADVEQAFAIPDMTFSGGTHVAGSIGQVVLHRDGTVLRDDLQFEGEQSAHGTVAVNGVGACPIAPTIRGASLQVRDSGTPPLVSSDFALDVRMADRLEYELQPTGNCPPTAVPGYLGTEPLGEGPMDLTVVMPREVIGRGKTIQLLDGRPEAICPPPLADASSCSKLTWHGQLTLTRVGTTDNGPRITPEPTVPPPPIDPNVPVPLTPPAPAPTAPTTADDDLLAPLVPSTDADLLAPLVPSGTASAARDGSSVSFRATCATGCAGTATLHLGAARATLRAQGVTDTGTRMRVRVAARPGAQTVRLSVPRRQRAALRRSRHATLAVRLAPRRGGAAVTRTLRIGK